MSGGLGSRLGGFAVGALVVSTFLPYVAIPAGASTSIPLSSLLSLLFLTPILRYSRVALVLGLLLFSALVATLVQQISGTDDALIRSFVSWAFYILPLGAFGCICARRPELLIRPIKACLIGTAVFCVYQYAELQNGRLPFLWLYSTPGFASVEAQEFVIVNYIRRPFAQFAEPSFLAGTVALALAVFLVLIRFTGRSLGASDWLMVAAVYLTIFLTSSGSGLVTLAALSTMAMRHIRVSELRRFLILVGVIGAIYVGAALVSSRQTVTGNYSWQDRTVSLQAPLIHVLSHPFDLIVGLGKGGLTQAFDRGEISLEGFVVTNQIRDAASVLVRSAVELGILGIAALVIVVVLQSRGFAVASRFDAAIVGFIWLVVGGLTIGYDSAAWLWVVPGVGIGLLELRDRMPSAPAQVVTAAGASGRARRRRIG